MCKTKRNTLATTPKPKLRPPSSSPPSAASFPTTVTTTGSSSNNQKPSSSSSSSSASSGVLSLASIKDSLSATAVLYPFSDITSATNNFLAPCLSSSSTSSWRCSVRGKDAAVFQHKLFGDPSSLPDRLSSICRSNHSSLVTLLGASFGGGDCLYIVYEYVAGASLSDCLRNPKNPEFTVLSSWVSRIQIAADIAGGLDYIHNHTGRRQRVHNRVKSSSIMITEPNLHAKICHAGTSDLTGELQERDDEKNTVRIIGTRGYIAPEIIAGTSPPSQKSDVFAYGVVLLELLTGDEPVKYRRSKESVESVSLIDTAREVMAAAEEERRRERVRRWVDRRLKDSFPVEVVERAVKLALECVEKEAGRRPEMVAVAGKVSRMLLRSTEWAEQVRLPTDFSVSLAAR